MAVLLAIWGAGGPEDGIEAARQFVTFLTRGTEYEAASWFTPEVLAAPSRVVAILAAIGLMLWVIWPESRPKPIGTSALPRDGKYVVGGRIEDEPGVRVGLMPTAEALRVFAEPASELVPLGEAAGWFYDNASQDLKDWTKDMSRRCDMTITEYIEGVFRTSWQDERCDLYGRWEPGLQIEKIDHKDFAAFDAVVGSDKRNILDQSVKRDALQGVLAYYEEAIAGLNEPVVVRRDTPLREGLMFFATGKWGLDPREDSDDCLEALGGALQEFRQRASDGDVTVWGKSDNHGVWVVIDKGYWVNHWVDLLDVLRRETGARTKAYNQLSNEPIYLDLMVCRAEFEKVWRTG